MRELFLASSVEAQRSTSSYRGAQEERWRTPLSGHRSAVTGPSCQKEADDWLAASDTEKEWLRPSGDIVVSGTKRKFQDPSVENTRAKPTRTSLQSDVPTIAKDCDKVACSITFAQQSPSSSDGVLVVPESHSSESHSSESHSSESQPSAPSHLSEDVKR